MSEKNYWDVDKLGLEKAIKKMNEYQRYYLRPELERVSAVQKDRRKIKERLASRRRWNETKYSNTGGNNNE